MSYDDDIDAVPSLCDKCFARLEGMEPTLGIGWKLLVFKCAKCGASSASTWKPPQNQGRA